MSLPRHLFAPAFRHQGLTWLFISIVAIMVYLATFAMSVEAALSTVTLAWGNGIANHMTVEIPALEDESSMPQSDRIRQALAILNAIPEVQNASLIPAAETARLLKPWINDSDIIKNLPLPALIDVETKKDSALTSAALQERLKTVVSDATVDDHAAWLGDLARFVQGLTIIAGAMLLLSGAVLMIVINLICRAVMATEKETVELLHNIGASDNDIARHFQSHISRLSWPAVFGGFALALITLGVFCFILRHIPSPMPTAHWGAFVFSIGMVPFVAIIGASLSARHAVVKQLQHLP